jgi:hypothetical protein
LGLFVGAARFGTGDQRRKICLLLDRERYRFQKFISDIAGQDIAAHGDDPERAIKAMRTWLSALPMKEFSLAVALLHVATKPSAQIYLAS